MSIANLDDSFEHHGVKGMHWGVRRDKPNPEGEVVLSKNLKNGAKLVVRKKTYDETSRLYKLLNSRKKFDKDRLEAPQFTLTNKHGEKVGEAGFYRSSPTSLELEWIGVRKAHRRNGYARAAMEGVIKYAKSEGITELNLTATDMGQPLYEALGFKKVPGQNGGYHQLKISSTAKHTSLTGGFSDSDIALLSQFISDSVENVSEEGGVQMSDTNYHVIVDDTLAHHGVKGMKWGVRRDGSTSSTVERTGRLARKATDVTVVQKPGQFVKTAGGKRQVASKDAVEVAASRQLAKKSTTDSLSNKQLQDAVTRMNLEMQYSKLVKQSDRRTRGQRFVHKLLGTDNAKKQLNNNQQKANSADSPASALIGAALKAATKT